MIKFMSIKKILINQWLFFIILAGMSLFGVILPARASIRQCSTTIKYNNCVNKVMHNYITAYWDFDQLGISSCGEIGESPAFWDKWCITNYGAGNIACCSDGGRVAGCFIPISNIPCSPATPSGSPAPSRNPQNFKVKIKSARCGLNPDFSPPFYQISFLAQVKAAENIVDYSIDVNNIISSKKVKKVELPTPKISCDQKSDSVWECQGKIESPQFGALKKNERYKLSVSIKGESGSVANDSINVKCVPPKPKNHSTPPEEHIPENDHPHYNNPGGLYSRQNEYYYNVGAYCQSDNDCRCPDPHRCLCGCPLTTRYTGEWHRFNGCKEKVCLSVSHSQYTHLPEFWGGGDFCRDSVPGDDNHRCATCGPCGEGEGPCSFDSQCKKGLKCFNLLEGGWFKGICLDPKKVSANPSSKPSKSHQSRPIPCGTRGDVNQDGKISDKDVDLLVKCVKKNSNNCNEEIKIRGDVNGDGQINVQDIVIFENYLTHRIDLFPICRLNCSGDFNQDGVVDILDLGIMCDNNHWGKPGVTDLNHDGTTDVYDISRLIEIWGQRCEDQIRYAL